MTQEAIAQLAVLANKLPTLEQTNEALGLLDSLEAEIEQLTKERDEALRHGVEIRDDWLRGVAEIERLTENNWPFEWQVATAEREKRKAAEAEIERLRATLTWIASLATDWDARGSVDLDDITERARAALDPSPPTRAGVKLEDAYRGLER